MLIVAGVICLFFFIFLKKIEKTEEKSSSITVQCLNVEVENKLWENYVKNPNEYNARKMDDFFNNCSMRGHVYRISDNKSRCERNQSVTISIAELGDFHR